MRLQKIEQDGFREVETDLPGKYQQTRVKVGEMGLDDEYVDMELNITNLVLQYDLGWSSVLNSSSLIKSEAASDLELSFLGAPFVGSGSYNENEKEVTVNELRFTSDFSGPFQVLAGAYYEDRTVDVDVAIRWNGRPPAPAGAFFSRSPDQEQAEAGRGLWRAVVSPVRAADPDRRRSIFQVRSVGAHFAHVGDTEQHRGSQGQCRRRQLEVQRLLQVQRSVLRLRAMVARLPRAALSSARSFPSTTPTMTV